MLFPDRVVARWATRHLPDPLVGQLPVVVGDLELSRPLAAQLVLPPNTHRVELLARLHGEPLGLVDTALTPTLTEEVVAQLVEDALSTVIDQHLKRDGASLDAIPMRGGLDSGAMCPGVPPPRDTLVSVVIPTARRPQLLAACIQAVLGSTHTRLEVLVVDNAPADPRTRAVVEAQSEHDDRVHYLAEPVPGASVARNTGAQAAQGDVLAFTDDDVVVDRHWVAALLRGLDRAPDVVCATGLTLAREIETVAQLGFERYGAWPRSFAPRRFDLTEHRGDTLLYPWTAGVFGASNNLAVRRDVLLRRGGFEERMGPATPTYGGEDLDLMLDLVLHGGAVAFEPFALARHSHRREIADLCWQVFTYGTGMTALLTRWAFRDRRLVRDLARSAPKILAALRHADIPAGRASGPLGPALERRLRRLELAGYVYGPVAWARAARVRRSRPAG